MYGVTLGGYHSYTDLGLILQTVSMPLPTPKTSAIDVPGMDGSIDLTEAFGPVKMQNRVITMTLSDKALYLKRYAIQSGVSNLLHGKKVQIKFDEDPGYYYIGRLTIGEFYPEGTVRTVTITADCDPYKYEDILSDDDWLWDPFNFETDVIRAYKGIAVSGTKTVTVVGGQQTTIPTIITDAAMTVTINGTTYNLASGENKIYSIVLDSGETEFTFAGTGTVSIRFRGTSL